MIIENVYLAAYDNVLRFRVESDGVAIDEEAVTRTQLHLDSVDGSVSLVLDSNTPEHTGLLSWVATGVLELKLAETPGLIAGRWSGRLVVFDGSHPDGIVWGDEPVRFNVIEV